MSCTFTFSNHLTPALERDFSVPSDVQMFEREARDFFARTGLPRVQREWVRLSEVLDLEMFVPSTESERMLVKRGQFDRVVRWS